MTDYKDLSLSNFLREIEERDAAKVLHINDRVHLDYEMTAVAMLLEQKNIHKTLIFHNVEGSTMPIAMNVYADRDNLAAALNVDEAGLLQRWSQVGDKLIPPEIVETARCQDICDLGDDVNLDKLPIFKHFADDGGAYISNGIFVAKGGAGNAYNLSFHRLQRKSEKKFATSLHSRRHLWSYQQSSAARDEDLPVAIIVGCHPVIGMGGLWKGDIGVSEYDVIGGIAGRPLPLVACKTVPLHVPADAEVIIEGWIRSGQSEDEGPFGEFTGYSSERSTRNVLDVTAVTRRSDAIWQDIVPGMSDEHCNLLAAPQEARLLSVLRQQHDNIVDVAYPKSGTSRLHAIISVRNPTVGEVNNIAAAAFGDDLSLKLAVVVDEDVDIRDDREVWWAIATRFQAGRDLNIIRNCMGAILDPSNDNGLTDKMIIDATKKSPSYARRHSLDDVARNNAQILLRKLELEI